MNTDPNHSVELLRLEQVALQRGGQVLLQDITLHLHAGEIITIIGPNGAGKTSLLKIILGLYQPDSGTVSKRKGLRQAWMPQRVVVPTGLPMDVARFLSLASNDRIDAVLADCAIAHLKHSSMNAISGGEMQRVLLARALLQEPELLLLDEPAQGLDLPGQDDLYRLIADIRSRLQCGVIMVSHDLHWVMAQTDNVLCLNQHICCHGHPKIVSTHPQFVSMFGERHAQTLALYQHQHNHSHDLHGDITAGAPAPDGHEHCSHD